jgi:DNA-directed RNA polymerase III subunit RPC3
LTSKSKIHELLAGYAAILAGEDDQNAYRAEGVFLGRDIMAASASGPQYMVLFERICSRLKRQLLESFVEETQGPMGKRVFNAVMHGDKVTEEMVSHRDVIIELEHFCLTLDPQVVSKALIKGDDARIKLSALKTASLVTFQAISRTADRSASRCTFLYYVDLSRAYQTILSRMYKSLANIHQRKEMIYQEYEETFNNSQRSDVLEKTGKMDERDQVNLVKMEKELDKLNTAQLRMETNVFVLRDLPGGPLSVR